jgi:hypothetical protein
MKYLFIILLIVSCGKHEQPGVQDYRDSDGDGRANTIDQKKFIADITEEVKVNGSLTFDDGTQDKEFNSYGISSDINLAEVSKRLLTQHEKASSSWKYTSNYLVLHLTTPKMMDLADEYYNIELNIDADEKDFSSIKYIENNITIDMGRWVNGQPLKVGKKQLQLLLKNESHLALEKIKNNRTHFSYEEKTYKIFLYDGNDAKVFHVSHEFPIEKFIALYTKEFKTFNAKDILYKTLSEEKNWWVRNLQDSKIMVFANEKELYNSYLKGFEKRSFILKRENGVSRSIQINKHNEAKVILNISGSKTINIFNVRTELSNMRRQTVDVRCKLYYRDKVETESDILFKELANEILLSTNNANMNNRAKMSWTDSMLQIKIDSNDQNIDLSLDKLPLSTYQEVGLFQNQCGKSNKVELVNQENKIVLNIEALVEKI